MPSFPPTAAPREVTGLVSCSAPAGPTPDGGCPRATSQSSCKGQLVPCLQPPVSPHARCHGCSRLQGCTPAPTSPSSGQAAPLTLLFCLLLLLDFCPQASTAHQHRAEEGRHVGSCTIHLQVPWGAAVSPSKPHRKLQHPLPSPTRSCSIHLQTPQGAAASNSKPHQEQECPPPSDMGSCSIHLQAPVVFTSKPYGQPWCPPPNPTGSHSIQLQTPALTSCHAPACPCLLAQPQAALVHTGARW